jgi:SAM-dependent methyltransferase
MGQPAADQDHRWTELPRSYDVVADVYAATFDDELDGKPRDRELLTEFSADVADPVVDLGCGPGQIGAVPLAAGRHVIGLDRSEGMARLAGRRLDGALVADMRALPFADASIGGVVAFYSVIHVERHELAAVLREVARVLRTGGSVLLSAHEGEGRIEVDELLGQPVPFVATLFMLDELVAAAEGADLEVTTAERRDPYESEHPTGRLYLAARRPLVARAGMKDPMSDLDRDRC